MLLMQHFLQATQDSKPLSRQKMRCALIILPRIEKGLRGIDQIATDRSINRAPYKTMTRSFIFKTVVNAQPLDIVNGGSTPSLSGLT